MYSTCTTTSSSTTGSTSYYTYMYESFRYGCRRLFLSFYMNFPYSCTNKREFICKLKNNCRHPYRWMHIVYAPILYGRRRGDPAPDSYRSFAELSPEPWISSQPQWQGGEVSKGESTERSGNALVGVVYPPPVYGMIGNSNTGTGNSGKSVFKIDCARGTASSGRVADVRPIDPYQYIVKKRRSSRFQRGIAHRQQTSFTVTVTPGLHRNG